MVQYVSCSSPTLARNAYRVVAIEILVTDEHGDRVVLVNELVRYIGFEPFGESVCGKPRRADPRNLHSVYCPYGVNSIPQSAISMDGWDDSPCLAFKAAVSALSARLNGRW